MENYKSPVPPFSVRNAASADDWSRWKQTLEFYFTAEKITDAKVKQAKLLLLGGPEIQDLYFSLPTVTQYPANSDEYSYTVECLEAKIKPKSTKWYERHLLNHLRQESGESITAFLTRVRKQAKNCSFRDTSVLDEAIHMQIIEGCLSTELRNRLLEKEDMTLDQVEKLARTLECVTQQASAITGVSAPQPAHTTSTSVCRTPHKYNQKKKGKQTSGKASNNSNNTHSSGSSTKFTCYCCGNEGHRPRDPKCPAQNATCSKCKKKGHFAKVCKSRSEHTESRPKESQQPATSVKAVYDEHVFCVQTSTEPSDELVTCHFGGIPTESFIDSGTKWTMMSKKTWGKLRRKGVQFLSYIPNPDVNFFDASGRVQHRIAYCPN